jgi:VanZ family protein
LRRPGQAIALGIAFAISDEIHQSFVEGRQGAVLDVGIDTVGVVVGALLAARRWASEPSQIARSRDEPSDRRR